MGGWTDHLPSPVQRLLRRRFAREVLTLQVGSFATMGTQLVTSVIIANLLNPEPFGIYYQARSLLDMVTMLANLAVGQALITPLAAAHARKDEREAKSLLAYFLKVGLLVALIESAIGLLGGHYLGAAVLNDPVIGDLSRILFITPPLTVIFNMVILALQSSRQVKQLALLENGALMATSVLNLSAVAMGWGVSGLLYSVAFVSALTSVAALLLYNATLSKMPAFPTLGQIVRTAPAVPFRRYFAFSALVSVDKNFANLISLAPTILLGRWASDSEVAYYRIATNLTVTLMAVPMSPISRNLYAKLAEVRARFGTARIGKSLIQVTLGSLAISTVLALGLLVVAPFMIRILYKPAYLPAVAVMYALGVRCAMLGFSVGLGPLYQVLDVMPLAIASKIVPAIVMVGGGWFLIGSMGAVGAGWTVTATYLVGDLISAGLMAWLLKRERSKAPPRGAIS